MTGMELETPRLRLRPWRAEDRAPFAAINGEPSVLRFLLPVTREQSDAMLDRVDAHFAQHGWGFWAVEERASGTLIGMCGLYHIPWPAFFTPAVEIGWRAAQASLDCAFGPLGLDRVVSFTVPANKPSWGLMERLGMRKIGEFDNPDVPPTHPFSHHVVYEIRPTR